MPPTPKYQPMPPMSPTPRFYEPTHPRTHAIHATHEPTSTTRFSRLHQTYCMTSLSFPTALEGRGLLKVWSLLSTCIAKILINNYVSTLLLAEKVNSSLVSQFLKKNRKTIFIKHKKQFFVIKLLFFSVHYVNLGD